MEKLMYDPDKVSPPGYTIHDLLEDRAMTRQQLAESLGVHHSVVIELIKGSHAIDDVMAASLERALGVCSEFWLARERRYRANVRRRWKSLQSELDHSEVANDAIS